VGIDQQVLRFLASSKSSGVSFASSLMIGRQGFHALNRSDLQDGLKEFGIFLTLEDATKLLKESNGYVEAFLGFLGAGTVASLDNSSYEGATVICDLNAPIPGNMREQFSCVFDSGTLEHVFNFPQAIKNCMEMVSIGGHLIVATTANNFMGHGFYQFSPELYYRILSDQNGFVLEDMVICETDKGSPWYKVSDPENLGRRVELVNRRPTYLMVRARKLRRADIFSTNPQQSDYAAIWAAKSVVSATKTGFLTSVRGMLPESVKKHLRRLLGHRTAGAFRRVR